MADGSACMNWRRRLNHADENVSFALPLYVHNALHIVLSDKPRSRQTQLDDSLSVIFKSCQLQHQNQNQNVL